MEFQKFEDLLKRSSSAVLLCHHNADPDSICSAYGFLSLLEMINPGIKVEISAPFGISKLSRKILDKLTFKIVSIPNLNADFVCILDTNSIQQLGKLKLSLERSNKPIIIIDHHTLRQKNEPAIYFTLIDESATSTSEIVYNFFDKLKKRPSKKVALALFLGIAYDTKHFSIANAK